MTIIKSASVKVMRSYDYCHFETSMSLENDSGIVPFEIDLARKDCQRLCDKAVVQYKKAKDSAAKRTDGIYAMQNFEAECKKIQAKNEHDRTLKEIGMLKEYEDQKWRDKFNYYYDYEDDENDRY
jgi:hypothetical protein